MSFLFTCHACGSEFTSLQSKERKYCSNECANKSRHIFKQCAQCQKPFRSRKPEMIYCGRACSGAFRRVARPAKVCEWCGKIFTPNNLTARHCSLSCNSHSGHAANQAARGYGDTISKACLQCEKVFTVHFYKAETAKCCSRACMNTFRLGKETKPRSERKLSEYTCQECGKKWFDKTCLIYRKRFCSRSCSGIWRVRANQENETTIETETYDALTTLGIEFLPQHCLGRFLVDAFLPGSNTVIECMGDFWHTNPNVYPEGPKCYSQTVNAEKDKKRFAWLEANGYRIVKLWEKDIRRHGAKALIEAFIIS